MNKKSLILLGLIAVIIAGFFVFKPSGDELTDQEIKDKFDCDRVTTDYRSTDMYCNETDLYRQHLKENRVVED